MTILMQILAMHNKRGYEREAIRCPKCNCSHLPKWRERYVGIMGDRVPYCGDCGFEGNIEEFIDWTIENGCLTVMGEEGI